MPAGFSYVSGTITGLPTGATVDDTNPTKLVFTVPTDAANGTDSFDVTFAVTNTGAADGAAQFEVEARTVETTTGDEECDPANNTAVATDDATVTVEDAEPVILAASESLLDERSEERRVGKECVSTGRSGGGREE